MRAILIRKKWPLWFKHPDLPWGHNIFMEVENYIFIFSIWLSESQPGVQKHLNSQFFPRQAICSSLVQFSFPFRDILFGCFSTIRLWNSSKHKMMFIEIDSLCEAGFHAGLAESIISPVNVTTHNYVAREVSCCLPVWWVQKWGPRNNFSN